MIYEKVNDDLKASMKSGDATNRDYIRFVKSEISKKNKQPSDDESIKVLKSLRKEAVENGADNEIIYLDTLLPVQMSRSQIEIEVSKIILGKGLVNFGQIMGTFNKEFKGKADNKLVSEIVKEQLG